MVFNCSSVKVLLFFHVEENTNIQISLTTGQQSTAALQKFALADALLYMQEKKNQHEFSFLTTQSYSKLRDTEPKKTRVVQTPQGHLIQQFAQGKSPGDTNSCSTALPENWIQCPQ